MNSSLPVHVRVLQNATDCYFVPSPLSWTCSSKVTRTLPSGTRSPSLTTTLATVPAFDARKTCSCREIGVNR